ncbi:LamG domain-containing protein [Phormidium sp. FACHB-592]|uniref:LamG domain-containing protein n=1 Tax=Stenomitos frigidus AS-A4 TaxID=2933935 RepID=A0ABV0KPC0_9CYAN|nr:LamG domain-containing protein [Phormidium sp. FACHB-592]MBD2074921.1 LamG domain-containing protein [Phormidium sp. FACHB-592]
MFPNLPHLSLKGPFWSAEAEVIQLADPQQNWAFRSLFLDINPKNALGAQNLLLPGTLLVLCWVKQVRVTTANTPQQSYLWQRKAGETSPKNPTLAQIETLLKSGQLVLLLVEADPDPTKWRRQNQDAFPELVCLAGDINLDVLTPAQDVDRFYAALRLRKADDFSKREDAARLLGAISVHGSGLSIAAKVRLPWATELITAVFQLARTLPDPSGGNLKFRLTLEADRLTAEENDTLINRWNNLSSYLNSRNPQNRKSRTVSVPNWVTLEIANPLRLPRLYWEIANWQEPAAVDRDKPLPILFERGEINLLLSDQQPYDTEQRPTSLAQIVPDKLSIQREGDRLTVALESGKSITSTETLKYTARLNQSNWDESLELQQLQLAFSSVQTAQLLRDVQKQSIPEWIVPQGSEKPSPIEPSLLWGFMPLEDGWAQLPIPNLTEQIYLDANLVLEGERKPDPGIFAQGAVSLGNSREDQLKQYRNEQPWSITWTDASYLTGTWQLQKTGETFQLQTINLDAIAPEVVLNGFLWLSTQAPTAADALPSVENWISSLQSVPLKSIEPQADLFPPLMTTRFEKLEIKSRSTAPQLQDWSMIYGANATLLNQMVTKGVLPTDTFSQYPPIVWRRHKSLPMVQALPLTQSQSPPNYPSPNRQLVPFQLAVAKDSTNPAIGLPNNWKFGVALENGAASWCTVSAETAIAPAADWQTLADLPLVALSLPGVVLDPNRSGKRLPTDDSTQLPLQYRFDLPYSDEINALAQLPKIPRDPKQVSPLPDDPQPQPPKPLIRETLAAHWQQLSERASLASADATKAIALQGGQTLIRHLVEPFDWQVKLTTDLDTYPGSLNLANSDNSAALLLTADTALKGVSGDFAVTQNRIDRLPDDHTVSNPFHLEAGSMAAHIDKDGTFRDQRGLLRSATHLSTANSNLLKTPVRLEEDSTNYELTSLLTTVSLNFSGNANWQFWFRDLPVKASSFDSVRSKVAQDVNDPDALSRKFNYLEGYEWRLVGNSLFSLDFFPLTLQKVVFANDQIDEVRIVGRLQLPLPGRKELEQFNNAVQVTFKRDATGQLQFDQIERVSPISEWFLALEGNESSESPLLQWSIVEATPAKDGIVVRDLDLTFTLFETSWTIALSPLTFCQGDTTLEQTYTFSNPSPSALLPDRTTLKLDLDEGNHDLDFFLQVRLGDLSLPRLTFAAQIHFPLLPDTSLISAESVTLFGNLKLTPPNRQPTVLFNRNALKFQWQSYELDTADASPLQLLPGMPLRAHQSPGYVALTFGIELGDTKIPTLKLQTAFTEAMLSCQWSEFLQSATVTSQPSLDQVFGSSAGDLVIGYTDRYDAPTSKWKQSLLLNGFLEVKSLISWALDTAIDTAASQITLPAARTANPPALKHLRHTARILFNQTSLTADRLIPGQSQLLFALKQPWQFLAVVEHQLTRILPNADLSQIELKSDDRWTAVQEVRLFTPSQFKQALNNLAAAQVLDPTGNIAELNRSSFGYWNRQFRQALTDNNGELDRLPKDTLLVDASAPHWIRKTPVKAASPTTLQFLPNGAQLGILSNPSDYSASDPHKPDWLLLTTPFFGRLQNPQIDHQVLTNSNATVTGLQIDPILAIQRQRTAQPRQPLSDLPRMLANWSDDLSITVRISGFDSAIGRSWARLNALSLEESWFRLQHPKLEQSGQLDGLQSILASLPDTPARLSRATALNQAFTVLRSAYPPEEDNTSVPNSTALDNPLLVWRPDSLMATTGVAAAEGLQALYLFQKEGDGKTVRDVSGVGTPLDLTIADSSKVEWLSGGGLRIKQATQIKADQPALKIIQACRSTNELTIEAWIQLQPNQSVQQGPARIVTLSNDTNNRYFTLGQGKDDGKPGNQFVARLRIENMTSSNGILNNGLPPIETNPGSVKAGLTHVVLTRRADGEMKFYINGQEQASNTVPNKLFPVYPNQNTDQIFRFILGNELTGDRPWLGDYRQVALFNRALPAAEVKQRFDRGVSSVSRGQQRAAYPWSAIGLQVFTSGLSQTNQTVRVAHHAAATELPARLQVGTQANPLPLSLTVSPYLGLAFRPAPVLQRAKLRLLTAELLCLDRNTGTLLPAASHVWAIKETQAVAEYYSSSQTWARETHRSLCPDSPIAILRFRELREIDSTNTQANSPLLTTYAFALVTNLEQPLRLVKHVVQLRSTVAQLRFREGQLGPLTMPSDIQPFELAPPQVKGLQPLHLTQRPKAQTSQTWDWGLSALRLSVQYGEQSAIGKLPEETNGSATTQAITLWWQAPQHQVQFRSHQDDQAKADSPQDDRAKAGLPAHFRATAIQSLLPVLPNLPLPHIPAGTLDQPPLSLNGQTLLSNYWQPVLPASLRYLLLGARSGTMFAIRNQLLRQSGLDPNQTDSGKGLVSGSIPVQHRIPRPVPLLPNQPNQLEAALQTWASYFEPTENYLHSLTPADEAFFGAAGTIPARRLRMTIANLVRGEIPTNWDGTLIFAVKSELKLPETEPDHAIEWKMQLSLEVNGTVFPFEPPTLVPRPPKDQKLTQPVPDQPGPNQALKPPEEWEFKPKTAENLLRQISTLISGSIVTAKVEVTPASGSDGFFQTLTFSLRVVSNNNLPLPLEPHFILFEDPEYNRRLASSTATASRMVQLPNPDPKNSNPVVRTLTLACDRREYNIDSSIFLRFDWDDADRKATLKLFRFVKGIAEPLKLNSGTNGGEVINPGELKSLSLKDIQTNSKVQLQDGDVLELRLIPQIALESPVILQITIVANPVIPVPQAAYALLRQTEKSSVQVECVRFAWSPAASRIELVSSEDLKTQVVRRRAVFKWQDSARPQIKGSYAIQKITLTGSTHFPTFPLKKKVNDVLQIS